MVTLESPGDWGEHTKVALDEVRERLRKDTHSEVNKLKKEQ
jgi:hypothetical protein